MYEYNAVVCNVVDGDTFDLIIDLGFNISQKIRVRLLDIDTPETRSKNLTEKLNGQICSKIAKKFWLNQPVTIQSYKDHNPYTDSFGRYLVYIQNKQGLDAVTLYNSLGMNKKSDTYDPSIFLNYWNTINKEDN